MSHSLQVCYDVRVSNYDMTYDDGDDGYVLKDNVQRVFCFDVFDIFHNVLVV